jgi:hypothetical protein
MRMTIVTLMLLSGVVLCSAENALMRRAAQAGNTRTGDACRVPLNRKPARQTPPRDAQIA